jgi:phenylpropionate dioxygenase-like ring-hydroxylating dioxygenase large terminal subunit
MSLEFGIVANHGIRCAYHGWCYGIDGRILETPGESPQSKLRERICHGAYPVVEYKGLIFAYFGPPECKPAFPRLDMMELPGNEMVPWQIHSPCNRLQVSENSMDPFHAFTRNVGRAIREIWANCRRGLPERDLG